jgi:hypothetical protein
MVFRQLLSCHRLSPTGGSFCSANRSGHRHPSQGPAANHFCPVSSDLRKPFCGPHVIFFATLGLTHEQIIRKHQSSTPDAVPMAINHLLLLAQFLLSTKSDFSGGRYVRTTAPHQRSCFVIRFRSCDRVAIGLRLSRAFSLSCGRGFSPAAASLSLFPGPPATTLLSSVSLRQLAMLRRH